MAQHLNKYERFYIEKSIEKGLSIIEIARDLGRNKTTIYREIKRNQDSTFGFYSGLRAQTLSQETQIKAVRRKSIIDNLNSKALAEMQKQLKLRSNPEQIAHILTNDYEVSINQQTIYRYIWKDRAAGGKLYQYLRRRGKRYKYKNQIASCKVTNKVSIETRPKKLALMLLSGNWEIDTIYGLDQKSHLLTLVDMATMYTVIRKIPNREAETVENALDSIINETLLPFKSITSDNGKEFANHWTISNKYNIKWYFCHPYCSGERGLNENTNGLIRDFYPKKTDFNLYSNKDFLNLQNILNNRPRKRLGFISPAISMVNQLMAA